jgi:hypothetical protein
MGADRHVVPAPSNPDRTAFRHTRDAKVGQLVQASGYKPMRITRFEGGLIVCAPPELPGWHGATAPNELLFEPGALMPFPPKLNNREPGVCEECGEQLGPGRGVIHKDWTTGWHLRCPDCAGQR